MNPASIILHLIIQHPYLVGKYGAISLKGLEIDFASFKECFDYCEEHLK